MLRRAALFLSLAGIVHCDGCRRGQDPSAASEDAATTSAKPAMRSPAEIRRDGNHLVGQASLYLTQHAHNPVDWYPWTPETLARAKSLGRPVFLSIGYSSCHWCHVMEREVFEDDEVASVLNEEFVAIKVDREERPDVDATFMDALQAMNGSGGWPASLFLTPDLEPFFGGTYFPKAEFLSVVRRAAKELKESGASLAQRGAELRDRIAQSHAAVAAGDKVRLGEIEAVARQSLTRFDEVNGGFRGRTKFPNASSWRFLLHAARRWGAPFEAPVKQTLDAMATGGLFDHIGGGFFRYATEPTWSVPHFEKMLYANAALASLYIEAWAAFGEPRYRTAARATLDFLLREMQDGLGGFYASLDADSDGKEGAFYVFTAGEMKTVLGDAAAPAAMKAFGATNTGNFEGANVLTLRPPASPESPGVADATLKLFLARAPRVHPRRDDKLVTAWNGLAIEALARGHAAFGDVRYLTAASQAADRLWTLHRPNGRLVRTSTAGRTGGDAMLDDYATFAAGLIALSEASGGSRETNPEPLGHALELLAEVQRDFGHPNGGFYASRATDSDGGAPLARRIDPYDGEEPCGSSVILATLLRAAALTGRPELYAAVDKGLAASAESARRSGLSMASFLDAALLEAAPFYDVVLAGTPGTPGTPGALDLAYKRAAPAWSVRVEVPAAGPTPRQQALLPATEGKVARGGTATAYVCIRGACKEPTTDPAKLRAQLLDGWQR